jgi:hypothetical protein
VSCPSFRQAQEKVAQRIVAILRRTLIKKLLKHKLRDVMKNKMMF